MAVLLSPRKGFYLTLEFGLFGWGKHPQSDLLNQFSFGVVRFGFGRGDIAGGLLEAIQK